MFKKTILFFTFFILSTPSLQFTNSFQHDKLVLPSVHIEEPFWCFEGSIIRERKEHIFKNTIEKWNSIISDLWKGITNKIEKEIEMPIEELEEFLQSSTFKKSYETYLNKRIQEDVAHLTHQEQIDQKVLEFIQSHAEYLGLTKKHLVHLQDNITILSTSFGLDSLGHALICNKKIYNINNVEDFFKCIYSDTTNYFIEPDENIHRTRCIELPNLLHIGIAEAVSGIIHQSHAIIYLITNFEFNNKSLSQDLVNEIFNFIQLRSFIEASLQTKNPLESALFLKIQQTNDDKGDIAKNLWQDFIEDVENCYDEEDLELYESNLMQLKRRSQ